MAMRPVAVQALGCTPVSHQEPFVAEDAAVMHNNGGNIFWEVVNLLDSSRYLPEGSCLLRLLHLLICCPVCHVVSALRHMLWSSTLSFDNIAYSPQIDQWKSDRLHFFARLSRCQT